MEGCNRYFECMVCGKSQARWSSFCVLEDEVVGYLHNKYDENGALVCRSCLALIRDIGQKPIKHTRK